MEGDVAEGAVVALGPGCRLGMAAEVAACLRATHRMKQLRGRRGGSADDVQRRAAAVGGHLAAAAGGIGGGAHGLQKHLVGCQTHGQAQGAIAIVGKEPVVARTQGQGRAHLQRLMAGR